MIMRLDRRQVLLRIAAGAGTFAASAVVPFRPLFRPAQAQDAGTSFPQGVASGDPQPDAVVMWTRALAPGGRRVSLVLQVSTKRDFERTIVERRVAAPPESDFTVRVLVDGLEPYTRYFYRFLTPDGRAVSPVGRTLTAPRPDDPRRVRFAFASCQNYEQGFYGAWARLVRDDEAAPPEERIDFVLHLGDFIYEVRGDRPDSDPADPTWLKDREGRPREMPPFPHGSAPWSKTPWGEQRPGARHAVALDDYRHLYKTYLSDPDLQAARARFPFVCTWDDHEFSNNCWQTAETYFSDATPAQRRRAAANRAWFEFIPALLTGARSPAGIANPAHDISPMAVSDTPFAGPDESWLDRNPDNLRALATLTIYRTLRWGKHLMLAITDTRAYRSPPVYTGEIKKVAGSALAPAELVRVLDAGRTANDGRPPATLRVGDTEIDNPRAEAPPGTMLGPRQKAWFKAVLKASDATWKVWANSVPAMPLRLNFSAIPFADVPDSIISPDAWAGYPGELRELMAFARSEGITNFVSCAGDHHMHGAALLSLDPDADEPVPVAAEFACAGISSSPMFAAFEHGTRTNDTFRAMTLYEEDGEIVENLNVLLRHGTMDALLRAWTGFGFIGRLFGNRSVNPYLKYVDTNAQGYGVMTMDASEASAELVTVAPATTDYGPDGAPVIRRARFRLPAWSAGGRPRLEGPMIEGRPPFPRE